jgi:primosomal protein N' (replication factor Y)
VERLEEEAAMQFPDNRIMVLSSDLIASIEPHARGIREIEQGRVDIVIGTQLVAKGHHFPKLNLVGVLDADLGPRLGRSARRRAHVPAAAPGDRPRRPRGRHGVGYLQTHQPEHPVMKALIAQDREAFYDSEIARARASGYPPFGRLASLLVTGADKHATEGFARQLAAPRRRRRRARARAGRGAARAGARPPSLPPDGEVGAKLRSAGYLREWLAHAPKRKGDVKLDVDVDPQSFLYCTRRALPPRLRGGLEGAHKGSVRMNPSRSLRSRAGR